jgi:uncharacterized membrane protein
MLVPSLYAIKSPSPELADELLMGVSTSFTNGIFVNVGMYFAVGAVVGAMVGATVGGMVGAMVGAMVAGAMVAGAMVGAMVAGAVVAGEVVVAGGSVTPSLIPERRV